MPDREKVIEWADKCTSPAHESEDCNECPYHLNHEGFYSCIECLLRDTVALLKEQEAKIEQLRKYINWFSKDAVPVVRCKDCENQNWVNAETGCIVCKFGRGSNPPDWFCADGKRRTDDA